MVQIITNNVDGDVLELFIICMKKQNYVLCLALICQVSLLENLSQILFSLFLNDLTQFMSKCYDGLKLLTDEVHSVFDNQDVEVYFKLYLFLCAEDIVIFCRNSSGSGENA